MNKKNFKKINFIYFLLLFISSIFIVYAASQYYQINSGAEVTVDEHEVCKKVTNNNAKSLFVPTNTAGEWQAFRDNAQGVSFQACGVYLVNGIHTESECTDNGGSVVSDGSGNDFCRFSLSSCPSGWSQYEDWSTTESKYCKIDDFCTCCIHDMQCTTGEHSWSNSIRESCNYEDESCNVYDCNANVNSIGCY